VETALFLAGHAEIIVGLRVVRFDAQGSSVRGHGLVQFTLVPIGIPEVILCLRMLRVEAHGSFIRGYRVIEAALLVTDHSQIEMVEGIAWVLLNGLSNELDGLVVLSNPIGEESEVMQRLIMIRVHPEDLLIELFGFLEAPCLVMRHGLVQ